MNVKELLKNKRILAAIAIVLVAVVLLCVILGGNKAEKAVKNYIKYNQEENAEALYKTYPKVIRNYLEDEDMEENTIESLESQCEYFNEIYDDCTFKVLDVSDISEDELDDLKDSMDELVEEIDVDLKLQDGKYVIVKVTDEDGKVSARTFTVLKINGSWIVM